MSRNIIEYIESIPEYKTNSKKISLYKVLKRNCPVTVRRIKRKLKRNKSNWYFFILEYLVAIKVLYKTYNEEDYCFSVNEKYKKYFAVYSFSMMDNINIKKSLYLYKNTSGDFIKMVGLKYIKKARKNDKEYPIMDFLIKKRCLINNIGFVIIIISLILLLSQSVRFGFVTMISIYSKTILFTIGFILYCF